MCGVCFYDYQLIMHYFSSKSHDLLVAAQVVDQVCQGVVDCVPRKTDHKDGHPVKKLFIVPEYMLHPHTQLRVLPVNGKPTIFLRFHK